MITFKQFFNENANHYSLIKYKTNFANLTDLYLCVSATRPKNMDNLLNFLEDQMDMERDVWDIDDLHDPEFKMRSHLNG